MIHGDISRCRKRRRSFCSRRLRTGYHLFARSRKRRCRDLCNVKFCDRVLSDRRGPASGRRTRTRPPSARADDEFSRHRPPALSSLSSTSVSLLPVKKIRHFYEDKNFILLVSSQRKVCDFEKKSRFL